MMRILCCTRCLALRGAENYIQKTLLDADWKRSLNIHIHFDEKFYQTLLFEINVAEVSEFGAGRHRAWHSASAH